MIRVLIAEDQNLLRDALGTLLGLENDLEVVGLAGDGDSAFDLAKTLRPDVVVADIEMPGRSGLQLAEELQGQTRLIIVTTFARPGYLRRALEAGVRGYLLKDSPGDVLPDAIRKVAAGGRVVDPALAFAAWSDADPLSTRDREVLVLAEKGLNNAQIASRLSLSEGTVKNYVSQAMAKLQAQNRTDAVHIARNKGWL